MKRTVFVDQLVHHRPVACEFSRGQFDVWPCILVIMLLTIIKIIHMKRTIYLYLLQIDANIVNEFKESLLIHEENSKEINI